MNVELLYHTPDPERAIATAARLCYAPVGAAELMESMSEERQRSVLKTIMASDSHRLDALPQGGFPLPLKSADFQGLAEYLGVAH